MATPKQRIAEAFSEFRGELQQLAEIPPDSKLALVAWHSTADPEDVTEAELDISVYSSADPPDITLMLVSALGSELRGMPPRMAESVLFALAVRSGYRAILSPLPSASRSN